MDQQSIVNTTRTRRNIMKHRLIPIIVLLLAPLEVFHAADASVKKPNVILLVVDDLGYGDVSCLANGAVKTPNIDRLAKTGVKFTSGYVTAAVWSVARRDF